MSKEPNECIACGNIQSGYKPKTPILHTCGKSTSELRVLSHNAIINRFGELKPIPRELPAKEDKLEKKTSTQDDDMMSIIKGVIKDNGPK